MHTLLAQNAHPTDLSLNGMEGQNGKGSTVTISESPQSLLSLKSIEKNLANRGFYKKKPDTRFDTHCIKIGVQLWSE